MLDLAFAGPRIDKTEIRSDVVEGFHIGKHFPILHTFADFETDPRRSMGNIYSDPQGKRREKYRDNLDWLIEDWGVPAGHGAGDEAEDHEPRRAGFSAKGSYEDRFRRFVETGVCSGGMVGAIGGGSWVASHLGVALVFGPLGLGKMALSAIAGCFCGGFLGVVAWCPSETYCLPPLRQARVGARRMLSKSEKIVGSGVGPGWEPVREARRAFLSAGGGEPQEVVSMGAEDTSRLGNENFRGCVVRARRGAQLTEEERSADPQYAEAVALKALAAQQGLIRGE